MDDGKLNKLKKWMDEWNRDVRERIGVTYPDEATRGPSVKLTNIRVRFSENIRVVEAGGKSGNKLWRLREKERAD